MQKTFLEAPCDVRKLFRSCPEGNDSCKGVRALRDALRAVQTEVTVREDFMLVLKILGYTP